MYVDRRRIELLMRRALDRLGELERIMWEELTESMREMEAMLDARYYSITDGVMDPLYTVIDRGSHVVVVVDLPGSNPDTIVVEVREDSIRIDAKVSREAVVRALHGIEWASRLERYSGVVRLPFRIDRSTVRLERRGSTLIIRARKLG